MAAMLHGVEIQMGELRNVEKQRLLLTRSIAALLLLTGLWIGGGGVLLVALDGSAYYLLGGCAVALSAIFLWRADRRGALIYAIFLGATLIWALAEAGWDGWALAPRLIGPAMIGLLFALPGVRRALTYSGAATAAAGMGALCLLVLLIVGIISAKEMDALGPRPLAAAAVAGNPGEWPSYGRTLASERFSPLAQITSANVEQLQPAWTYHMRIAQPGMKSTMEATPIMIGDSLYTCTQTNMIIALDPETGQERWRFDPHFKELNQNPIATCRGVAYFRAPGASECAERIISATYTAKLFAVDARSGRLCRSFGQNGFVNLMAGLGTVPSGLYRISSAPTIVRGNIVLGGFVMDAQSIDVASGVVRAYDAVTGRFAWAWDIGRPGDSREPPAGQTYTRSTPNSWAPMSGDEQLGLVYVPTGNASPDHWGGNRTPEMEKYASSLVALDALTGTPRWSFQTVHHDLWDYDVPSAPTLLDVRFGGRTIPAAIQPTKRGEVFVLDRRTGVPIFPVKERAVPQRGVVSGERLSPTQPYSVGMASFAGPDLRESDMWGLTPLDQLACRITFRRLRYEGRETPPGTDPSLIYPSVGGGMNWGGISVDPTRRVMIVNSLHYGTIVQLVPRKEADRLLAHASGAMFDYTVPLPQKGAPYAVRLYGMNSPLAAPCNKPPYGKLSAVDLDTGKLIWSRPFGSARDTGPLGIASRLPIQMGMPNFGGSITTAGGIVFIGATQDRTFRAFDINNGRLLWSTRLPAGGNATPMTYLSPKSGRQFVVIVASGYIPIGSKIGDAVVAYALPKSVAAQR
jgi:membrane-bound PQQ-dependent dehydrogenase (glucose/quinate/shikimate family)